ncbi:MAG TPA: PDZ domain-containing protein [Fodinibius sp.]|nr:PDZ domain-containing protein [Fodinibius sp.]
MVKAAVKGKDFEQLFINGEKQHLARYPNFRENVYPYNGWVADAIDPERVKSWKDPTGGYVHALHSGRWGGFHYRITGKKNDGALALKGGWQNNRPSEMHPKYRFVENIYEELDTPGEWYLDRQTDTLYYYPPDSINMESARIEVSGLNHLMEFRGSQSNPVRNIVIDGLTFAHTGRTFMKTKEPLLRSDWTIYRGGAILLEGTERITIRNSDFKQLGGNAIFISRYNRNGEVSGNYIHDIGASAVSLVGDPGAVRSPSFQYQEFVPAASIDTTSGPKTDNYPSQIVVEDNLIRHIGRVEKQVAGVQISMSADIDVRHNTIYHVPRAGINISDGTWGGHLIAYNDVFKTVLETSDHGAFNSWGRDRFWHPNRAVMDSLVQVHPDWIKLDAIAPVVIRNNRFQCDNGWDIDLDDGSSNYKIYNNLCLSGGIKLREGFDRTVENNITVNNGLHPHVWFAESHDTVRNNIFMNRIQDIRLQGWGDMIDYNFYSDSTYLAYARKNGVGKHSVAGDPRFKAPEDGDYRVMEDSKALDAGFENFPMDNFGVTSERLKKLAAIPEFPMPKHSKTQRKGTTREWLGAKIKYTETLGEQSAAGLDQMAGVLILQVDSNSSAAKADLQEGDVIIEVNGTSINTLQKLFEVYQGHKWKEQLRLSVVRNQQVQEHHLNLH